MSKKNEYIGSAYIGVVGPDGEFGSCRDSIEAIARRPGDSPISSIRATKGYEARQMHLNRFLETKHDFALLLDHDMVYPSNVLDQLRNHKLPYVSGLYMRRNIDTMAPVWYRPYSNKWPISPWVGEIPRDNLHHIGASGWGCILVHRDVVLAVRDILKGENEVLEDDMDIWPYDLGRIMEAINGLDELVQLKSMRIAPVRSYVEMLKEEIVPLRCDREQVGSDIRFPFFALQAGYKLYGDPNVRCGHITFYPLGPNDYETFPPETLKEAQKAQTKFMRGEWKRLSEQRKAVINA